MMAQYGSSVDSRKELRQCILDSVEGSLKRVGTDHFDLLMCPHGGLRGRRNGQPAHLRPLSWN